MLTHFWQLCLITNLPHLFGSNRNELYGWWQRKSVTCRFSIWNFHSIFIAFTNTQRTCDRIYTSTLFRQFNTKLPAALKILCWKFRFIARVEQFPCVHSVFAWHYHFCVNAQLNMHFMLLHECWIRPHPSRRYVCASSKYIHIYFVTIWYNQVFTYYVSTEYNSFWVENERKKVQITLTLPYASARDLWYRCRMGFFGWQRNKTAKILKLWSRDHTTNNQNTNNKTTQLRRMEENIKETVKRYQQQRHWLEPQSLFSRFCCFSATSYSVSVDCYCFASFLCVCDVGDCCCDEEDAHNSAQYICDECTQLREFYCYFWFCYAFQSVCTLAGRVLTVSMLSTWMRDKRFSNRLPSQCQSSGTTVQYIGWWCCGNAFRYAIWHCVWNFVCMWLSTKRHIAVIPHPAILHKFSVCKSNSHSNRSGNCIKWKSNKYTFDAWIK